MENTNLLRNINQKPHPRQQASFWSKLFFCWSLPLFVKGFREELADSDLYRPFKWHESKFLGDRLEKVWKEENRLRGQSASLWRALWRVFGTEIALLGAVDCFIELVMKISQPLFIGKLLLFYEPNQTAVTKVDAYFSATMVVLIGIVKGFMYHSYVLSLHQLGMKIRVSLSSLIYRKSLKLSKRALAATTIGQLINLLSNDVSRFNYCINCFQHLWIAPLETIVVLYLLYANLGLTSLVGIALLFIFLPLQFYLGKRTSFYRLRTALHTDKRVCLMDEVISGIQLIKMYTWEIPFAKLVEQARKLEMKQIRGNSFVKAVNFSFSTFLNKWAIYLSVVACCLMGHRLQAQYVFVLVPFYNILRQALSSYLSVAIRNFSELKVTVKRIETFLKCEEIYQFERIRKHKPHKKLKKTEIIVSIPINCSSISPVMENSVQLLNASAKWITTSLENTLTNVNFYAGPQQKVAVIGTVGSGKTSLLYLILKELPLITGKLSVQGRLSYAPQEPWLFSGSIRQNITFGQPLNEEKYKEIIKVCALETDFDSLPYGDSTIIGEKGVTLSGGQRARINLARAVYIEADIYLLDDPLSAVDVHVGRQLFDNCIFGYLKEKCIILATHQIQFLRNMDRIYVMENGTVVANGTLQELQNIDKKLINLEHKEMMYKDTIYEIRNYSTFQKLFSKQMPIEITEQKKFGKISKKDYSRYVRSGGSVLSFVILILLFFFVQLGISCSDYFLTFWVNLEQRKQQIDNQNEDDKFKNNFAKNTFFTTTNCLYIYTCLILFVICMTLMRSFSFFHICLNASVVLHNNMFTKVLNSPVQFFKINSLGSILNRFSKDIGSIDETLPDCIFDTIEIGLVVLSTTTIVILSVSLWMLIPTLFMFGLFHFMRMVFLSTSRNIKRIESTSRSPLFSHISATLRGLPTIRAFGTEEILKREFDNHQDVHTSAYYMFISCNRAFAFWLDLNCTIYMALVTFSSLIIGYETYGGNVGLAITQSVALTSMLQWGMRQWSEFENQMTSVERILEYIDIKPEPDEGKLVPQGSWPEHGRIEFKSVSLKYADDEPFVLKNLNFLILPGEKIGVVGRTGAGKTSLVSILFRLAHHVDGKVLIDSVNMVDVPLKNLRSSISIIPQEPMLFSGTLRKNLDPFDEFDDDKLWGALADVEMKTAVADLQSGLEVAVFEGGSNFSIGQRQLLCLARAVLRSNRILILDEATSNVDSETDELIQRTIRRKFQNKTVLTIAHRLNTVMDSDKILVMDAGNIVEFDHPHNLLQHSDGMFLKLVEQTGKPMADFLKQIAEENYKAKILQKIIK